MNLTIILLVLDLTLSHIYVSESDTLFWRGYNCVSRFEFMTIQPESINAQLYALGLSSKTDVLGFDSKLVCLSSDMLTPGWHLFKQLKPDQGVNKLPPTLGV